MKKIKSLFLCCLSILAITCAPVQAQTNQIPDLMPPVGVQVVDFFTTPSSNWYAAVYGIVNTDTDEVGFGVAAFYKVNDFVGAFLRVDSLGGSLTMPSGNFQLQLPITIMGKFTAIPFAFTGVAFPIGRDQDPDLAGLAGFGFAFRLPQESKWYVPKDVLIDIEKWTNTEGLQLRGGLAWRF